MSASIFIDKSAKPDDALLMNALGKTGQLWLDVKHHIEEKHGPVTEEWKMYSPKFGWQLKILRKKRNLFFLIPLDGYFRIIFVFGDKAVSVVDGSELPDAIKTTLRNARKYMEGRSIPIDVKLSADAEHVKRLIDIKVEN